MSAEVIDYDETHRAVGLYFDLVPGELIDLEVAASAAIEWSKGIRAAANAVDASYEYRVNLIVAEPGSSRWVARIERIKAAIEASSVNQASERLKTGWQSLPLILRMAIGLVVALPLTAKPTLEYWLDSENFNETELKQIRDAVKKAEDDLAVQAHRKSLFAEAQRDRNIKGVGAGVPDGPNWRPKVTIPADQFAEMDGLFEPETEPVQERIVVSELDVILVTPQLENARRVWVFRQEGISGVIRAEMKDKKFLAALEQSAIRETLRVNIPMTIRLEIKQHRIEGEWKVMRRGRSVVQVISPKVGG